MKTILQLCALVLATPVFGMNLTFDVSQLGSSTLNATNVYVTFAGATSDMIYDPNGTAETINFSGNNLVIGNATYGTSKAYSLQDINTNGLRINSAQSITGYISYGSTMGISQLAANLQPSPFTTSTARWSNFEFTYTGGNTGGADLTNISQFGGSLRMDLLEGNTSQAHVKNTLNTGDTFRALAATSGNQSATTISSSGNFVRVLGANVWPASVNATTVENPYPSFEPYLQHLTNTFGSNSSSTLTNLVTGQAPGGSGAVGTTSTANATSVTANISYNLDYHFGSVTVNGTGGNGSSVTLSGYVNATPTTGGNTTVYSSLSITVDGDNPATMLSMTNFLYQQTIDAPTLVGVTLSGWSDLINDFGAGFVSGGLQQKVAGDFSEGILMGLVGSTTTFGNATLGSLTSKDWFTTANDFTGSVAQPINQFYSLWGNVVNGNSNGFNGGNFTRGGVYGSPFDDRFALNTISPNGNTTGLKITLLADGDLAVIPEPTSVALLISALAFCLLVRKRFTAS